MGDSVNRKYLGIILVITLVAFSPCFIAQFVMFDDDLHIFQNPVLALPFWQGIKVFWTEAYRGFYIPMTYTFWSLIALLTKALFSFKNLEAIPPYLFHYANLVFHLANISLVFLLLRNLFSSPLAVLAGTFLFAAHPVQVETVAWATGFKDLISTLFCLTAIHLLIHHFSKNVWQLPLATMFYVFALLSKPSSFVIPLILVPIFYLFKKEQLKPLRLVLAFWFLLALPFAYLTSRLQPQKLLTEYTPLYFRPFVALDAISFYLQKLLLPLGLVLDYSRAPLNILASPMLYFSLGFLCLVIFLLWKYRKWEGFWFLGTFILSICPVLGLIPFAFQNFSTVADHYLYLPMIVVAIFTGAIVSQYRFSAKYLKIYAVVLGVITFWQVTRWTETKKLMQYTLFVNPRSMIAHNNLAVYYEKEGMFDVSLKHYEEAARINPLSAQQHYNKGNLLLKMDRMRDAEEAFKESLKVDPSYVESVFSMGLLAEAYGDYSAALRLFERSSELDPLLGKASIKAGTILVKQGKIDEGIQRILAATESDPRVATQGYLHLGNAYLAKKEKSKAREAFQKSLLSTPGYEPALSKLATLN